MGDIDPLTAGIEQLQSAVTQRVATGDAATIEVGPDGALHAIRLTDYGRRLSPDALADAIVRLHAEAVAEARTGVADAVARLESDPRLRAQRNQMVDALNQPFPHRTATPSPQDSSRPDSAPDRRREPTPEEEEEMDHYYQRKSWLE